MFDAEILEFLALPFASELLRGRDAIYEHITEAAFREAFALHFVVRDEVVLGNGRAPCFTCRRDKVGAAIVN